MPLSDQRYITPAAQRYLQRSEKRLLRIKQQREKQRRRDITQSLIFIGIGLVFVIGLFFMMINSGNLSAGKTGFSSSFERLLRDR